MGYVLILISLMASGEVDTLAEGVYPLMSDCFEQREFVLEVLKSQSIAAERSIQAICLAAPEGADLRLLN